jgi:hypothetical protein
MPNANRAREKTILEISMAGLARVHDRYLRGCSSSLVLGDSLEKDRRWLAEIERILIGSNYMTHAEIRARHLAANAHWLPEYDIDDKDANFKH